MLPGKLPLLIISGLELPGEPPALCTAEDTPSAPPPFAHLGLRAEGLVNPGHPPLPAVWPRSCKDLPARAMLQQQQLSYGAGMRACRAFRKGKYSRLKASPGRTSLSKPRQQNPPCSQNPWAPTPTPLSHSIQLCWWITQANVTLLSHYRE